MRSAYALLTLGALGCGKLAGLEEFKDAPAAEEPTDNAGGADTGAGGTMPDPPETGGAMQAAGGTVTGQFCERVDPLPIPFSVSDEADVQVFGDAADLELEPGGAFDCDEDPSCLEAYYRPSGAGDAWAAVRFGSFDDSNLFCLGAHETLSFEITGAASVPANIGHNNSWLTSVNVTDTWVRHELDLTAIHSNDDTDLTGIRDHLSISLEAGGLTNLMRISVKNIRYY
jgi:hypothetical protein